MKKRVLGVLLPIILGGAVLGLFAEAAESCPHNRGVYQGYNSYWYYINPAEHGYVSYFEYWCPDCDSYYIEDDESYVEAHDYTYDYAAGEYVCDTCGDRYK